MLLMLRIFASNAQNCAILWNFHFRIHSETNIFRYDENISFAKHELMPCIDSYRDAHARCEPYPDEKCTDQNDTNSERNAFNPDWRQSVSVTYSFADGSAARSHAIQAALRPYRPTYFHFWQLKTFWHESKITDEDIEVHSFEEMETVPAMAVDQTSDTVLMVVNEMKAFRKDFIETLKDGGRSDLKTFWLRKTKKPVLAVLLVQKPDGEYILYRGTNMEVSMPTGSLCAERNVIGTALASDPGLKREDLLMVAVLAVPLPEDPPKKIIPPPGVSFCQPINASDKVGVEFVREVEEKLKQHQSRERMRRSTSVSSIASICENKPETAASKSDHDEWEMDIYQSFDKDAASSGVNTTGPTTSDGVVIPELNLSRFVEISPSRCEGDASGNSTPKRRIALYKYASGGIAASMDNARTFNIEKASIDVKSHLKMGKGFKKQKRALLLQSNQVRIN